MKSKLSLALVLCMLISLFNGVTFIASAQTGDGSPENPIIIMDQAGMEAIGASDASKALSYKLGKNIILSSEYVSIAGFAGTFDGDGNAIYLNGTANGIFADTLSTATVKNVVTYGYVNGGENQKVAAIAGTNNGVIINCVNNANIIAGAYSAGIAGYSLRSSSLSHCENHGTVDSGGSRVGGIVGYILVGEITNCSNTGYIEGDGNGVAGIVGQTAGNGNKITNCYNTGNIKTTNGQDGGKSVAGIVGNSVSGGDVITSCYNIGTITHSSKVVTANNGIFGTSTATDITINLCFYLADTLAEVKDGVTTDTYTSNLSESAFKDQNSFNEWDFETVWKMETYPVLNKDLMLALKTDGFIFEIASQSDYNLISTYASLFDYFKVVVDFTLDAHTPIESFSGEFEGNNKTITFVNATSGLFATIAKNAIVKNVITSGTISGVANNLGAIAHINKGQITNCINKAVISGLAYTGGIAGQNIEGGSISGCGNTVSITCSGKSRVGGVVGYIANSSVSNCYNTAAIKGDGTGVGGIVGQGAGTNTISNCFNTGDITTSNAQAGGAQVAGILGNSMSSGDTIEYCYNIGVIKHASNDVSVNNGIFGVRNTLSNETNELTYFVNINNSYYLGDSACESKYNVNITGGNLSADKLRAQSSFEKWDFDLIWEMGKTAGYKLPVLQDVEFDYVLNEGTAINPYIIETESDLASIKDDLEGYYELGKNVEVSTTLTLTGFNGIFDGKGYTIDFENTANGLFLTTSSKAIVRNVRTSGTINSGTTKNIGAISGVNGGTIEYCINGTTINSEAQFVGGIAGHNTNKITGCGNIASVVSTKSYVGGIAGYLQNASVETSYNTGAINGSGSVGGIVGNAAGTNTITNCFNAGGISTSGDNTIGGILGVSTSACDTVSACYNIGVVTNDLGYNASVNLGILGTVSTPSDTTRRTIITDCYYLGSNLASEKAYSTINGGGNLSASAMRNHNSFNNWDFEDVWAMGETDGYKLPVLQGVAFSYTLTEGTEINPQIINDENEFIAIVADENKYYELGADLDLTKEGLNYAPIVFAGHLDGKGHNITIALEYAADETAQYVGLFSQINDDYEIKNINLHGTITIDATEESTAAKGRVGSLVGNIIANGSISNITSDVDIRAKYTSHIGGIIGYANNSAISASATFENLVYNGTIISENGANSAGIIGATDSDITLKNCINSGDISGRATVAGITGWAYGNITNCYNTGDITAKDNQAGGIAARLYGTMNIENCYNTGDVKAGKEAAGGIAAEVMSINSQQKITGCYNIGAVSENGKTKAGLIGVAGNNNVVENSYYLSKTAGNYGTAKDLAGMKALTAADLNNEAFEDAEGYEFPKLKGLLKDTEVAIYEITLEGKDGADISSAIKADKEYAKAGSAVTLTPAEAEDYVITEVEIGKEALTADDRGIYVFNANGDTTVVISVSANTELPSAPIAYVYGNAINLFEIPGITDAQRNKLFGKSVINAFAKVSKSNLTWTLKECGFAVSLRVSNPEIGKDYCEKVICSFNEKLKIGAIMSALDDTDYYIAPYAIYENSNGETETVYGAAVECLSKALVY